MPPRSRLHFIKNIVCLGTWLLFAFCPAAFSQIINNASFEGTPQQGLPPSSWFACNDFSSPDTQPGWWGVTTAASNGNTFISIVTRGDNTVEGIGTKLNLIKANVCYNLSIDLSASSQLSFDGVQYTPVVLRVWLAADQCGKTKLAWTSPLIDHTNWKSYSFNFTGSSAYKYLMMEAAYSGGNAYFGSMLIDNVQVEESRVSLGADQLICKGSSVRLEVDAKWESVTWSDGAHGYSNEVKGGIHWVEVQTQNCLLKDTVAISQQSPILIDLGEQIKLCAAKDTLLRALNPNAKYKWNTGSTESEIRIKQAGDYWVEVSNACEVVTDHVTISARENCCEISVPNVFTPNNDTFNDYFKISTESNIARFSLKIFNRWGGLVYETQLLDNYWDGFLKNGVEASSGVYYYNITLMCIENNKILDSNFRGPVSLVK